MKCNLEITFHWKHPLASHKINTGTKSDGNVKSYCAAGFFLPKKKVVLALLVWANKMSLFAVVEKVHKFVIWLPEFHFPENWDLL